MPFIKHIALILTLLSFGQSEKYLKVPKEGLKNIKLVLKDELSNGAIESYPLSKENQAAFLEDLNKSVGAPNLKMNITSYRFEIHYLDGRKVKIATNGKGLGPTPVGYFINTENLIFKYFPITRETFGKPKDKSKKSKGGGFGF